MKGVGTQFEDAAQLTRWGGRPEREFLHQRGALGVDEGFDLLIKGREFGVMVNSVQGVVVTVVALVFPDMDYYCQLE